MEALTNDVWVYVEISSEGYVRNVGLALHSPGRKLADCQKGKLCAVVIGDSIEDTKLTEIAEYGADIIYTIEGKEYRTYSTDAYAHAMSELIKKYRPACVLIGATNQGRDLAPRIACRLQTGLTADCTSIGFDRDSGKVIWTRPAFGGNLMADIICPDTMPQMGTVRPGVYRKEKIGPIPPGIVREDIHFNVSDIRTLVLDIMKEADSDGVDLESAQIIVAGGRGTGGAEGFAMIRQLAETLGGVVGASRVAVEEGWITHVHQVGQTGKTVNPRLYIACGISGAVQHIAGMRGADTIIAINADRGAPIFEYADYGIVGDMKEIIPELIRVIEDGKSHRS